MSICLLFFSVILVFVLFFLTSSSNGLYTKIRISFILSLIANAAIVFFYNELMSLFDNLNTKSAIIFWTAEVLMMLGLMALLQKTGRINISHLKLLSGAFRLAGFSKTNKVISFLAIIFFAIPLGFLAVYAPPNNFDSHNYHLNRVLAWIFNENLEHFPTMYMQQLYLNVFAEYLVLDSLLLSGSDRFAGLIQYGSCIGSLAGVSLLAKRFRLDQGGQLLSAIFLLTLPIGILESTSTQVDYCACFFFIAFVYFGFDLLEKKSTLILVAFLLSLSFGGFSKYTIFIFAIPFTLFFSLRILFQYRMVYSIKVLFLSIMILVATFTPFFYRNYSLLGHVMSPLSNTAFASEELPVDKYSILYTISGLIKNAGLHLGLPYTGFNLYMDSQIRSFHKAMKVDIDQPERSRDPFSVRYSVHEDMVPNTIHFWIILIASILLFLAPAGWDLKWLWLCSFLGFVLFCTLMKFQLWSTRTHMPFFAMGAIFVPYVFCRWLRWKAMYIAIPLMVISSVFVYGNPNKPLVPINFLTRKALAHIPVAICVEGVAKVRIFKKYLHPYYYFPGKDGCHALKKWPSYQERMKVFAALEQVGYYDDDRADNILDMDRDKAYFLSHTNNYVNFKPLLDRIDGDYKNIGVFFKNFNGFYHYWSSMATKVEFPGKMKYIRYRREFMILENAKSEFCYDYILADDEAMIRDFVPKENIDTVYSTQLFQLIKLKNRSCERQLF
jgi:hypothetical protein